MSVIAILQQLTTKAPVLAVREAVRRGGFSERAGCVTGNWCKISDTPDQLQSESWKVEFRPLQVRGGSLAGRFALLSDRLFSRSPPELS
jgi:hypothetical protein